MNDSQKNQYESKRNAYLKFLIQEGGLNSRFQEINQIRVTYNVYKLIIDHLQMKTELVPQPVLYLPKNSLESFKNYHFEYSSVVNVLGELFYEKKKISFPWKKL